jgi:uncharacterized membrane protein SirB2
LNSALLQFATWLSESAFSISLHESFYMYNWLETTHVMTLMLSFGMLAIVDLRMLGLAFANVPASKIAERLDKPMLVGFSIMFITGILLFSAIPVRTTQSLWFRIKVILLIAAAINAWLFRGYLLASKNSWDLQAVAPRRARIAAGVSLALWCGVIMTGRFIAYDWFDCGGDNPAFVDWAAGCVAAE